LASLGQRKTGIRLCGTPLTALLPLSKASSRFTLTAAVPSSMKGRMRPLMPQEPLLLANAVPGVWIMLGGSRRLVLS